MKHVLGVSPASGSTGASSIIAAQLAAEGDRLSADRANLDEALARYDRAIALEEPSARRLFRRSELRLAVGDERGAISDLSWALARPDADREAVLALRCRIAQRMQSQEKMAQSCASARKIYVDER